VRFWAATTHCKKVWKSQSFAALLSLLCIEHNCDMCVCICQLPVSNFVEIQSEIQHCLLL
jgi:hypothetical protein